MSSCKGRRGPVERGDIMPWVPSSGAGLSSTVSQRLSESTSLASGTSDRLFSPEDGAVTIFSPNGEDRNSAVLLFDSGVAGVR